MKRRPLLTLRADIPHRLYVGAGIALPLVLLVAWWLVTATGMVRPLFLPPPQAVLAEGWEQLVTGVLWTDASVSVWRIVLGWLAATIIALPLGILMGNYRLIEGMFEPLISTVRYMPVVALIPLTILWAGITDLQKILILFIGTFFQQVLMIMNNTKSVDMTLIRAGQTLGFSNGEILRRIVLPASMPGIWDTLRVTLGWTWTYLVVAELVAAQDGLGRRIMDAQRYLSTETILFGTIFIGLLGLVTDYLFKLGGRKLFGWAEERR